MVGPGSLRPLRTVRASFPAYGSSTFNPARAGRRKETRLISVLKSFTANLLICLHCFTKYSLHLRCLKSFCLIHTEIVWSKLQNISVETNIEKESFRDAWPCRPQEVLFIGICIVFSTSNFSISLIV